MTDILDARRLLKQRDASIADKIDRIDNKATKAKRRSLRRARGVTAEQALRTERKALPDEGVRSFGAPIGTEVERQRQNQSTDSNQ